MTEQTHDHGTHAALERIECLLQKMYERDGMILDSLISIDSKVIEIADEIQSGKLPKGMHYDRDGVVVSN